MPNVFVAFEEPSEPPPPAIFPIELVGDRPQLTVTAMAATAWPDGGVRRHAGHGRGNTHDTIPAPPGDAETLEGTAEAEK